MKSEDLITRLAAQAAPSRPLAAPGRRLLYWLIPTLVLMAGIVWAMGIRADIGQKLGEPKFITEVLAALLTGILAAFAALCCVQPGRPLWERLVPLAPLTLWLMSLGEGCWRSLIQLNSSGVPFMPDPICFPAILLVGTIPSIALFSMVRKGAPMAPVTTTALAALAASAMGAAALRLFHPQDASLMVLVWQFGSVVLLTGIASLFGRRLLRWRSLETLACVR